MDRVNRVTNAKATSSRSSSVVSEMTRKLVNCSWAARSSGAKTKRREMTKFTPMPHRAPNAMAAAYSVGAPANPAVSKNCTSAMSTHVAAPGAQLSLADPHPPPTTADKCCRKASQCGLTNGQRNPNRQMFQMIALAVLLDGDGSIGREEKAQSGEEHDREGDGFEHNKGSGVTA